MTVFTNKNKLGTYQHIHAAILQICVVMICKKVPVNFRIPTNCGILERYCITSMGEYIASHKHHTEPHKATTAQILIVPLDRGHAQYSKTNESPLCVTRKLLTISIRQHKLIYSSTVEKDKSLGAFMLECFTSMRFYVLQKCHNR